MKNAELRAQQEALADDAIASYNFGDGVTVVGSDSWQRDTFDGKDDWTKVVYVECDEDGPNDDSHKVSFHAAFVEGTTTLDEAYAYWCENGSEIGSPGTENCKAVATTPVNSGKTWIAVKVPGPWAVDDSCSDSWGIINTETGKTKKIGPVKLKGTNYFDRAKEEANRRNAALLSSDSGA